MKETSGLHGMHSIQKQSYTNKQLSLKIINFLKLSMKDLLTRRDSMEYIAAGAMTIGAADFTGNLSRWWSSIKKNWDNRPKPPTRQKQIESGFKIYTHPDLKVGFRGLASLAALDATFDPKANKHISKEESESRMLDNLVTISDVYGAHHSPFQTEEDPYGTGLQLTSDGWILTAHHVIEDMEPSWIKNLTVRRQKGDAKDWLDSMNKGFYCAMSRQGKNSPDFHIDPSVWATNERLDIALIKTIPSNYCTFSPYQQEPEGLIVPGMQGPPRPTRFKFLNRDLIRDEVIQIAGLRDKRLFMQYGRVESTSHDAHYASGRRSLDTVETTAQVRGGFSGGITTTKDWELVGTTIYREGTPIIGEGGYAKVKYARQLVDKTVEAVRALA